MSKEHLWPAWVRAMPHEPGYDSHILAYSESPPLNPAISAKKTTKHKSGRAVSRNAKVVCKSCNSGWMSRREEAIKPILSDLISGRCLQIDREAQHQLAIWVVSKSVVLEFMEAGGIVSTFDDRRRTKEDEIIPPGWEVWLGKSDPVWFSRFHRRVSSIHYSLPRTVLPRPDKPDHNISWVIWAFGHLLLQVATVEVLGQKVFRASQLNQKMMRFYPSSVTLDWQLQGAISQAEVETMPAQFESQLTEFFGMLKRLPSII